MAKKEQTEDLPGVGGPGVSQKQIKPLNKALDQYIVDRDAHRAATAAITESKKKVVEIMHAHESEIGKDSNGEMIYRYEDEVVTLKPGKEELKVKTIEEVT